MLYRGRVKMYSTGTMYENEKKRQKALKKLTKLEDAFKDEQAYFHAKKNRDVSHTVCADLHFHYNS